MNGVVPADSCSESWDAALDRLEGGLDGVELGLDRGVPGSELEPLPRLDGDLPEQLADRARRLLARTDALAHRVAGELSRTDRALHDLTHRVPDRRRHPAYLDTRA